MGEVMGWETYKLPNIFWVLMCLKSRRLYKLEYHPLFTVSTLSLLSCLPLFSLAFLPPLLASLPLSLSSVSSLVPSRPNCLPPFALRPTPTSLIAKRSPACGWATSAPA
eukprot:GHVT01060631.1.p1 GENE.GHVT01060631.1~~GHVT01060631.1.p1  ORF type:complete len:109 (+),score=7.20 GHVT01060631.1:657-983(+)